VVRTWLVGSWERNCPSSAPQLSDHPSRLCVLYSLFERQGF
jgi:hypothetical protein